MRFGIYLGEELMEDYDDVLKAYEDAIYVTKESGVPHEVKIIQSEKNDVVKATHGWNQEKKCVELQIVINEKVYKIPAFKRDLKKMMSWYELEETENKN